MLRLSYFWFPVFVWLALLAYLSSLPHIFITDIPYLVPVVNKLFGIDLNAFSHETVRQANFYFRKGLHVLVYLGFGFLIFRALIHTVKRQPFFLTLLILTTVAVGDEYRQSFHPARTANTADVFLDVIGGVIGVIIYFTLFRTVRYIIEPNK